MNSASTRERDSIADAPVWRSLRCPVRVVHGVLAMNDSHGRVLAELPAVRRPPDAGDRGTKCGSRNSK